MHPSYTHIEPTHLFGRFVPSLHCIEVFSGDLFATKAPRKRERERDSLKCNATMILLQKIMNHMTCIHRTSQNVNTSVYTILNVGSKKKKTFPLVTCEISLTFLIFLVLTDNMLGKETTAPTAGGELLLH